MGTCISSIDVARKLSVSDLSAPLKDDLQDMLFCLVCKKLGRDMIECGQCRHVLCKDCKGDHQSCSNMRPDFTSVHRMVQLNQNELQFYCPKCQLQAKLPLMLDHMRPTNSCF